MPITDIVVLDTNDLASCWQDGTMATLPQAKGDAPADYMHEIALADSILMINSYWTFPGPYCWVFSLDLVFIQEQSCALPPCWTRPRPAHSAEA